MMFKRFEPLTKGEKSFFMGEIPTRIIFAMISLFISICIIINIVPNESFDFFAGLIIFSFLAFLALAFPYMLVQFLVDIRNNKKIIFVFELTKKDLDISSDNNDYLLYHYEKTFRLASTIKNAEDFYNEIAIGDIIELHQLPKSGEFVKIQKIEKYA